MFELTTLRRAWARDDQGRPHPFHIPIAGGELNSHVAVLERIAREGRPSALAVRGDLSPSVDEVLHRAMAINPDDRFDSAAELATSLRAALLETSKLEDTGIPTLVDDEPIPTIRDVVISSPASPVTLATTETFDELATESEGFVADHLPRRFRSSRRSARGHPSSGSPSRSPSWSRSSCSRSGRRPISKCENPASRP